MPPDATDTWPTVAGGAWGQGRCHACSAQRGMAARLNRRTAARVGDVLRAGIRSAAHSESSKISSRPRGGSFSQSAPRVYAAQRRCACFLCPKTVSGGESRSNRQAGRQVFTTPRSSGEAHVDVGRGWPVHSPNEKGSDRFPESKLENRVDLVLLDMIMEPGIDGLDAYLGIRGRTLKLPGPCLPVGPAPFLKRVRALATVGRRSRFT